jgi:hypothetical protein
MEALGRVFNVVPVASGVHVSLRQAEAVTFVVFENGGATVIGCKESIGGASEQNLLRTRRFTSTGTGSGLWTSRTQTASATITKTDDADQNCTAFTVSAEELSNGFDCVECTVDGSATCVAILHDLTVQRAPENMPAAVGT